jgi:hypothetical protein
MRRKWLRGIRVLGLDTWIWDDTRYFQRPEFGYTARKLRERQAFMTTAYDLLMSLYLLVESI